MKKRRIFFSIIIFLFTLVSIRAKALTIDTNVIGQVELDLKYADLKFENANIAIYKVGSVDENGHVTYLDDFNYQDTGGSVEGGEDLDNGPNDDLQEETVSKTFEELKASEIDELARKMYDTIQTNNIEPIDSGVTNKQGFLIFKNLNVGLYLVKAESVVDDNYEYISAPQLLLLPTFDEINDSYVYEFAAMLKVEAKEITTGDETGGNDKGNNDEGIPNTFDAIILYLSIFVVAVVGIGVVVYYIKKSKRKDDEK